jgi:dipeptidyl aminopeptidase/acylaminoacyl peptidase
VTSDDLARLRDVADPQVSPDGGWVAYTVSAVDTAKYVKEYEAELGTPWKNPKAYLEVSYPWYGRYLGVMGPPAATR